MGGEETQPPAVTGFCEYRDLQIEQGFERSQAENGNRGSPPDAVTRNACDPKRAAIKETLYTQTSCTPVSQRVMSLPPSSPPIMALPGSRPLYIALPDPPRPNPATTQQVPVRLWSAPASHHHAPCPQTHSQRPRPCVLPTCLFAAQGAAENAPSKIDGPGLRLARAGGSPASGMPHSSRRRIRTRPPA